MDQSDLAGIPGTFLDESIRLLRWLVDGELTAAGQPAKRYRADVSGGRLYAIVSRDPAGKDGRKLWHVSVSHRAADGAAARYPSWDELKSAVYRLVQADIPWVLIFPRRSTPKENWVNVSETCLHLWESEPEIER